MTLPNFLIIGTKKAATTSLYEYVRQHPDVFMSSMKEPRYFSYEENNPSHVTAPRRAFPIRTRVEYSELFSGVTSEVAIGEASPDYLQSPTASQRIMKTLGAVPLIVSLRSPVERAYSSYLMNKRDGREDRELLDAFCEDEWWVRGALYYEDLRRYIQTFGPEKVLVLLFDDIKNDPLGSAKRIFLHIGVDPDFVPDVTGVHNEGGVPKSLVVQRMIRVVVQNPGLKRYLKAIMSEQMMERFRVARRKNLKKAPVLTSFARERMLKFYLADICKTEELIGRDLSAWKS